MRTDVKVLGLLLVATNAAWAFVWFDRPAPSIDPRLEVIEAKLKEIDADRARSIEHARQHPATATRAERPAADEPAAAGSPARAATPPAPSPTPSPAAPPRTDGTAPAKPAAAPAARAPTAPDALASVKQAKADVLQIEDATRRERGLTDIQTAMRSDDPQVVRAALATLHELRDVTYDKRRFRDDVVRRLSDPDPAMRATALYAFMNVEREPDDLDRVVALADGEKVPSSAELHVGMMLNNGAVDGALAKQFIRALAADTEPRAAEQIANLLRGMTVSPAVEDATVEAFRRRQARGSEREMGLWPYVLGQMQPGPRESRVRAIFDLLATGDDSNRQLASPALTRAKGADESARPLAAQLAAAALASAPTAAMRRTYIEVIRVNGSREQVPALRALAANTLVAEGLRKLAGDTADALDR